MTNSQLIDIMKVMGIKKSDTIIADSAEPERIKEIEREGFNISPAEKDVQDGIDCVLRYKPMITNSSENLLREKRTYKRKFTFWNCSSCS